MINLLLKTQLDSAEKKMSAYMALMNFRYMNLCIKAEPASLIPVTVVVLGEEKNIEDVAQVAVTDEYHLAVIPKGKDCFSQIAQAITYSHPEFIVSIKTMDSGGENKEYLEYEMPVVDKNRHDFLSQAVKSLYDETKVKIEAVYQEERAGFAEFLGSNSNDLDEVNEALDKMRDNTLENITSSRDEKLKEIEDGYLHYLAEKGNQEDGNSGLDVSKSMKIES
jgi:ribosome recycling factor